MYYPSYYIDSSLIAAAGCDDARGGASGGGVARGGAARGGAARGGAAGDIGFNRLNFKPNL